MPYTEETINQMQDEIIAMLKAWEDRGIPPADGAVMFASVSHLMLATMTQMKFDDLVGVMRDRWVKHGGQF